MKYPKLFVLVLAVALGVYVMFRAKRSLRPSVEPKVEGTVLIDKPKASKTEAVKQEKTLVVKQAAARARLQAGLRSVSLPSAGGKSKLTVKLQPTKRCFYGDLDAINASGGENLLLSIEPLKGGDGETLTREVSVADANRGLTHVFALPQPTKPVQLGLFLCSDPDRSKRCQGKSAADIDAVLDAKSMQKPVKAAAQIYYFQYLESDGALLSFFNQNAQMSKGAYQRAAAYAKEQFPGGGVDMVKQVGTMNDKLNSQALAFKDSTLTISLPMLDAKGCGIPAASLQP